MGQGYQDRDYDIVDYELFELPGLPRPLRGPAPAELTAGRHIVFVGAAQTFGCYATIPFPALVGSSLGAPALNLGVAGAGPLFFLSRPRLLERINRAAFAVVQVMSGRSQSNSAFESKGGELLTVRADGRRLGAAPAWDEFLEANGPQAVDALVEETRRNWVADFKALFAAIEVPTVLLWLSTREPSYERRHDCANSLFGEFPQLVDEGWLAEIRPCADRVVSSVSARGMPQRLISRFTGRPTAITMRADLGGRKKKWNNYYPSPEMHEDAAAALLPVCRELWSENTRT